MTRLVHGFAVLFGLSLALAACSLSSGKYESSYVFDNNCAGHGFVHSADFCADYIAE